MPIEAIKLNHSFLGKENNQISPAALVWVERPGVGYAADEWDFADDLKRELEASGASTNQVAQSLLANQLYLSKTLDPRFAPDYRPGKLREQLDRVIRPLSFLEMSGQELKLSHEGRYKDEAGYINYRGAELGNPVYVPRGIHLGPGDEFYRIRFYQMLTLPVAGANYEPKIAAEVIIVYNPEDSDSWVTGVEPHRLMHTGVRHIQWQGYTYKTPLYDLRSGVPESERVAAYTCFHVKGISIEDLDQIHDTSNRNPKIVIEMEHSPWRETTG